QILSLHSPYFLNIFYGDFCEKKQDIIHIPGISLLILLGAALYSSRFEPTKCEFFVDLLRFFDQFSFVESLNRLKIESAEKALELPFTECRLALTIIDYVQDDDTLKKFFNRFAIVDCLDELMRQDGDIMSWETTMHLTKRMAAISRILLLRPKIRFVFSEVVVSLLNDIRPLTIDSLISLIRTNGRELFGYMRVLHSPSTKCTYLPHLTTLIDQPDEEMQHVPILSNTLCLYQSNSSISFLFFRNSNTPCSLVGTVVSGAEIAEKATFLTSVFVE
ncbi:hypothetical protein PFISCL1PPCAC_19456, partial [Pristionchus fissidentatus]